MESSFDIKVIMRIWCDPDKGKWVLGAKVETFEILKEFIKLSIFMVQAKYEKLLDDAITNDKEFLQKLIYEDEVREYETTLNSDMRSEDILGAIEGLFKIIIAEREENTNTRH